MMPPDKLGTIGFLFYSTKLLLLATFKKKKKKKKTYTSAILPPPLQCWKVFGI